MALATIYVGAIGHSDCDALAVVAACTPERVEAELERIEREELTDYRNELCDENCDEDQCEHLEQFDMWTSGPMPESALDVLRNAFPIRRWVRPGSRDMSTYDFIDLREGVLHLPTF